MNRSATWTNPTINGWEAYFKPVWSAEFHPVQKNGRLLFFKTSEAAELAAWRTLYEVEQPVMTRDGAILEARRDAEKLFSKKGAAR